MNIKCGHCGGRHTYVAAVAICAKIQDQPVAFEEFAYDEDGNEYRVGEDYYDEEAAISRAEARYERGIYGD